MTTNHASDIQFGWCRRVRARLRPAEPYEIPPGAATDDSRVVEFFTRRRQRPWAFDELGLYNPLEQDDLLGDFLGTFGGSPPADRQVTDFYGRYGFLTQVQLINGEHLPTWAHRLSPESRDKLSPEARAGQCEPLWWVRELAQEVRLTYDLYQALRGRDVEALRALLGGVAQDKTIISSSIVAGRILHSVVDSEEVGQRKKGMVSIDQHTVSATGSHQPIRPLTEDECLHRASQILAVQLNDAEKRTWREWLDRKDILLKALLKGQPDGEAPQSPLDLVRVRGYRGLATALYLQLGNLIMSNQALYRCRGCQRLFYPKRSDQLYCTRGCGDAARQRGYYRQRNQKAAAAERPPRSARGRRRTGAAT